MVLDQFKGTSELLVTGHVFISVLMSVHQSVGHMEETQLTMETQPTQEDSNMCLSQLHTEGQCENHQQPAETCSFSKGSRTGQRSWTTDRGPLYRVQDLHAAGGEKTC